MAKTIYTLVDDVYELFNSGKEIPTKDIVVLSKNIAKTIYRRLKDYGRKRGKGNTLRMGSIGQGDKFLWYTERDEEPKVFNAQEKIRFLYGDILEELMLFFAEQAGHEVTGKQDFLKIEGVRGLRDAKISGVNTDVKSASPAAFFKFENRSILQPENDPFGYIAQASAYAQADQNKPYEECDQPAALFAINKSNGKLCTVIIEDIDQPDVAARIIHLKKVLASDTPPARCFEDEADGKGGNRKIGKTCSWCKFKEDCWSDANDGLGLRTFKYSNGWRFLTHVEKLPAVDEIKKEEVIK